MLIKNLIYILQLELYDVWKFLRFSYAHPNWLKLERRGHVVWTKKAILIAVLSVLVNVAVTIMFIIRYEFLGVVVIPFEILFLPLSIGFSTISISPIDAYFKRYLIRKAKKFLDRNRSGIEVIGITGSYGKTSTREILYSILNEKYKTVRLPENINTDVGIAEYILRNQDFLKGAEFFIVEMGAYQKGDIRSICELVEPDYSILTGINESHLERFGSFENIVKTKFELPVCTEKLSVLNFDDENIRNNYTRFEIKEAVGVKSESIGKVEILEDFQGLEFRFENVKMRTRLLGLHNILLILLCATIARKMGMSLAEISRGVEKISYVPHRLEPIFNKETDVWVIDDSYNGNYNGIRSGLEVLSRAKGRKIVLTPGLVELGEKTEKVHGKIAELYVKSEIDLVLLVKNKSTEYIINGLEKRNFEKYRIYASTEEAHADLARIIKTGDTIIFQNDLPDNYF